MGRKVLLDGQIKFVDNINIKPDSPALNFGCGFFETVLYEKSRAFFLKDHVDRITASALELKIPLPKPEFMSEKDISVLLEQNGFSGKVCRIKIMYAPIFYKTTWNVLITAAEYVRETSPVKGITSDSARYNKFYSYKTMSYMENYLQFEGTKDTEVLFTDRDKNITEGSRSNILCFKNDILFYTDFQTHYLKGIMQKHILADHKKLGFLNTKSVKNGFTLDFFKECSGVVMTNSLVISRNYSFIKCEKEIINFKTSGLSEKIRSFYLK